MQPADHQQGPLPTPIVPGPSVADVASPVTPGIPAPQSDTPKNSLSVEEPQTLPAAEPPVAAGLGHSGFSQLSPVRHNPHSVTKVGLRHQLSTAIRFSPTATKRPGSASQARLLKYRGATTLGGFLKHGSMADFFNDLGKGYVRFVDPNKQLEVIRQFPESSWKLDHADDAARSQETSRAGWTPAQRAAGTGPQWEASQRRQAAPPADVSIPSVAGTPNPTVPITTPATPSRPRSGRLRRQSQSYTDSGSAAYRWAETLGITLDNAHLARRFAHGGERSGIEQLLFTESMTVAEMLAWSRCTLLDSSLDPEGTALFVDSLESHAFSSDASKHFLPHVHDPWHEEFADYFCFHGCTELCLQLVPIAPDVAAAPDNTAGPQPAVRRGSMVGPEDVNINEDYLFELKKITDPEERRHAILSILKEIRDLCSIGTFELVDREPSTREMSSRLVLKVKYKTDGSLDKHKARLVVRGFEARPGIDFMSTFAPMASIAAVRLLMATAVHHGWRIIHSDIPQAFCQSPIDTEVTLKLPRGIEVTGQSSGRVLRVLRALYGMRQSPQLWNKHLNSHLVSLGFKRAHGDSCIYHFEEGGKCLFIATEVDDLVITGDHMQKLAELKLSLETAYLSPTTKTVLDWDDPIRSFLGINICYDLDAGVLTMDAEAKVVALEEKYPWLAQCGFKLSPSVAAEDVLHPSSKGSVYSQSVGHMPATHALANDAPLFDPSTQEPYEAYTSALDRNYHSAERAYLLSEQGPLDSSLLANLKLNYRSIVGSLIYIMTSCRPDLCFAVGKLSRHMHAAEDIHAIWLKRTIAYLRQTKGTKLTYTKDASPAANAFGMANKGRSPVEIIVGFTDANFANLREADRKSLTGFCFFAYGNMIMWKSKVQPLTACSTHEAELIALTFAADEAVWLKRLCAEIGLVFNSPIPIMCDNQGTVFTAHNPCSNVRSKHLDIRYFKVRQYIEQNLVNVLFVPTKLNLADFFTKSLDTKAFTHFRDIVMGTQIFTGLTVPLQQTFQSFGTSTQLGKLPACFYTAQVDSFFATTGGD